MLKPRFFVWITLSFINEKKIKACVFVPENVNIEKTKKGVIKFKHGDWLIFDEKP